MPKINKNCDLGDVVRVVFDDHAEGENHVVFEAFGRVLRKDRRSLVIACWKYADGDVDEEDRNMTVYTILRAAVKCIEVLTPKEPCQSLTTKSKAKADNSPRKRASSAPGYQVAASTANADTTHPEPPDSPRSDTTTGVPSTLPTTT
jgi:hypothetical protein